MWLYALSETQREALIGLAHNVVVSDGLLDPNEEGMLDAFKREMELHPEYETEYFELSRIDGIFDTRKSKIIALLNLLRISFADGAFEIEEECFLREVAQVFGISDQDFLLLENWNKRLVALEGEAIQMMND